MGGGIRTSTTPEVGLPRSTTSDQRVGVAHRGDHLEPASTSRRAMPARSSTESSAITMRMGTPTDRCRAADRAEHMIPTERGDALAQPGEAAARVGSAPPLPVVGTSTRSRSRAAIERAGWRGVLGHVREGFGPPRIGRALDRRRRPRGHDRRRADRDRGPATTDDSAASRPRSSRITGWMPRTRSRISSRAPWPAVGVGDQRGARGRRRVLAGHAEFSARRRDVAARRRAGRARCAGVRPRRCREQRSGSRRDG